MRHLARGERLTDRQENPVRIEALTDGIFAVAMTLLVLGLAVGAHEVSSATANADLSSAFRSESIGWKFLWFFSSFAVTSFFWVGHLLVFWTIERINRILVLLNIAFFVPIVLVPFTTSILGQYPHASLAGVLYVININAASAALDAIWFYSLRTGLIAGRMPPEIARAISARFIFVTALFAVAAFVAPFFPYYSIGAVLLVILYVTTITGTRLIVD